MGLAEIRDILLPLEEDGAYFVLPKDSKKFPDHLGMKSIVSDMEKDGIKKIVRIKGRPPSVFELGSVKPEKLNSPYPELATTAVAGYASDKPYLSNSLPLWNYKEKFPDEWAELRKLMEEHDPQALIDLGESVLDIPV